MESCSYTIDRRDLDFVLFEHLPLRVLLNQGPYEHVTEEDVRMIIQLGNDFASDVLAPTNMACDREGCRYEGGRVTVPSAFQDLFAMIKEQGWINTTVSPENGGQGLPKVLGTVLDEMMIGSNGSFHTLVGLCRASANLLIRHGSDQLRRDYVPKLLTGEWQGTMCLTEAGAGSDVGASTTRAQRLDNGSYSIKGTKVFITGGEHQLTGNHIHLVLARLPDAPSGVKGLSLFLVPRYRLDSYGEPGESNDVHCSKIEEKMGIHASPTCVMNFGDNDGCIGYLVGRENQGIHCMFHMMNEERIVVGLQGQALAAAMYEHAVKYAKERIQGSDISQGKTITDNKVPIIVHPDVRRLLMSVRSIAEGGRALLYATSLEQDLADCTTDPARREYHENRLALLTPICKAWGSDAGTEACSQALQVFGGSGFTRDFPAEQYLRDARIASIYEGTNAIQALDLLFRKVMGGGEKMMQPLSNELTAWITAHAQHPVLSREVQALGQAAQELSQATRFLVKKAAGDIRMAALGASPYLTMFGNVIVSWLLLQQAVISAGHLALPDVPQDGETRKAYLAGNAQARFYADKIETARFFAHQWLSQNRWKAIQVMSDDRSSLDVSFAS